VRTRQPWSILIGEGGMCISVLNIDSGFIMINTFVRGNCFL
jgi:hypothetical protein